MYRGISDFKKGYQPRCNMVKDEKGDLFADSHSIVARWRNYFSQLFNVHGVKDVGQAEIHTADLLVTEDWRRLHNEELNDLYSSHNIVRVIKSRRMRWVGHVVPMGEERGVYRILVRKPEGKRPLGRLRRRWVDNIRMDLQEVGCGYMDWIGLAQGRDRWRTLVSAVMNLRVV